MAASILLNDELVFLDLKATSKEEILTIMSENLLKHRIVHDSYKAAVIEREVNYATGLPGAAFGVAIPHTDNIHVVNDALSIARLNQPVIFHMMGTNDVEVEVEMVFLLAIKNPENQVLMLQSLMDLFQNEDALVQLKKANSSESLISRLKENVNLISNN